MGTYAKDLESFPKTTLIESPANDGDSFIVKANGKLLHIRLYFVDSPETSTRMKSDARRVREQTRYFGLLNPKRTIHFGNKAKEFVRNLLEKKTFNLYTTFANALGRSKKGRIYAFITTEDGKDLATLLVKNGLARTYGIGRKTPSAIPRDEMIERLRDFENSAMLKRIGIWAESDPDIIAESRAEQRREDKELENIQNQSKDFQEFPYTGSLIDINSAGEKELKTIKGIGPAIASRIISGRPYKKIDDLLKVKGIGKKKFNKIRYRVKVEKIIKNRELISP